MAGASRHDQPRCNRATPVGDSDRVHRRRKWTAEELAWLADVRQRLSGPLTDTQLAVLRHWWNGGYAADATDEAPTV
ncbi:hypothetical protein [Nocardia sp. CDC160]|uniref:hypothetical protein n=1 Tax=Nocardia sp. CDC160 TaxID=3112166 RepID=UPI002DB933B7|nr:hypothetical protein [Nocardia sp. CDC160]MEC3915492.1 hypothetical protein [Nocardia sp. CDC160]